MKNIVHDWSDEDCQKILTNIRNRLLDGGAVLIVEGHLPNPGQAGSADWYSFSMDMDMMAIGARERTETETKEMVEKAGFVLEQSMVWWVPMQGNMVCTIARKN